MIRGSILFAAVIAMALPVAGCSKQGAAGDGDNKGDKVRLQLKWMTQAQFAGYYAAKAKGFYTEEKLEVSILPGGPDIVPEQVVAGGGAEFGIDWLPSLLSAREQGTPLVNIAQVFQHSGMREVAFKTSGIKTAADLKGRKVAVWFGGNEFELLATLDKYGVDRNKDVTLVQQPFDMNLLVTKQVEAAAAMTYNEYKQVLDTGVKPDDLVVIDFNQEGTAMLEDGIFAKEDWLKDVKNKDVAARFLRASLKGWAACRDNATECVDIVLKQSPTLGKDHQTWMMTEVNKLVWGPPAGGEPGLMAPAAFRQTADIALKFKVIKKPAEDSAFTHAIWEAAKKK
ncbi:MAG TPA: ABC transporter substrate-binding protein [Polyangiaceae bacterium]|nr:ABC transporter substrate-binding protein [Polyangiaceae bacterium]